MWRGLVWARLEKAIEPNKIKSSKVGGMKCLNFLLTDEFISFLVNILLSATCHECHVVKSICHDLKQNTVFCPIWHPTWSIKVKPWSRWLIAARAYPGFCSMKRLGVFLLALDGMLVHHRSLPRNLLGFPNNLLVPIYTPGWRGALWELSVLPKNTTPSPARAWTRPLALETSPLTTRPPRLPQLGQ